MVKLELIYGGRKMKMRKKAIVFFSNGSDAYDDMHITSGRLRISRLRFPTASTGGLSIVRTGGGD